MYDLSGLIRIRHAPHLSESIHVERKGVYFSMIIRARLIDEVIEPGKAVDEGPDFFVICMEYMRPVPVHADTIYDLSICIPCDMISFLHNKNTGSIVRQNTRDRCAIQTCAYY